MEFLYLKLCCSEGYPYKRGIFVPRSTYKWDIWIIANNWVKFEVYWTTGSYGATWEKNPWKL